MQPKKTNRPAKRIGGVNKDPTLRVKASLPAMALDVSPVRKKKRLADGSLVVKKKKKVQTPSAALATVLKRKISKTDRTDVRSIVGDQAEKILQLLDDGNSAQAVPLIYQSMLQSLVDLIPLAEHAVRESKGAKGVYQINSLISSIRELMADIQSAQDRGMLGETIVDSIVRPSYADLATSVLQEYKAISDDMKEHMSNLASKGRVREEHFDAEWKAARGSLLASRDRLANAMQTQYGKSKDEIKAYLQR